MRKVLLDTDAYTGLLTADDKVLDVAASAEIIFMSIFVLGELHAGLAGRSKFRQNLDMLARFLAKTPVRILPATVETDEIFDELEITPAKTGISFPINDVWIAAHGLETGSVIISYAHHFQKIPGVSPWP